MPPTSESAATPRLNADTYAPRLNADTYAFILQILPTTGVLTCACVCSALKLLCDAALRDCTLKLQGTAVTGSELLWLARERMQGKCVRMCVSDCEHLTKAQIAHAVSASPFLEVLEAERVGPGSWSSKHVERLLSCMPASLHTVRIDCRLELKKDLAEESTMLASFVQPWMQLTRLTLIADNVSSAAAPRTNDDTSGASTAAAAAAAAAAVDAAAAAMAAASLDGAAGNDAIEISVGSEAEDDADDSTADEPTRALRRLRMALTNQATHLLELDASSGALAVPGDAARLLAPLLGTPNAALRVLSARSLSRSARFGLPVRAGGLGLSRRQERAWSERSYVCTRRVTGTLASGGSCVGPR